MAELMTCNIRVMPSCEAMGQSKEAFVLNAQTKSKNAWLASQQAALLAFKTSLLADEALFDAQRIRTICFETRTAGNYPLVMTSPLASTSLSFQLAGSQSVAITSLSFQPAGSQSVAATLLSFQLARSQCHCLLVGCFLPGPRKKKR